MQYKVIITGSTGMVGKGVLLECLASDKIGAVLVVNRSSVNIKHPKLKEILLNDFTKFDLIKDQLTGYDACFHCMGISASGLSEEKYSVLTYDVTKSLADTTFELNPNMLFNYVSGMGTDSSGKSRMMWARVKGKTENYILHKGFLTAFMFRPGFIIPGNGIRSRTSLYNFFIFILKPFFGLLKKSKNITSTTKLGLAMIATLTNTYHKVHLDNIDINAFSEK